MIGIAQTFAQGSSIALFNWLMLDFSAVRDDGLGKTLGGAHVCIADLIYVIVAVHVCAAIYHQIFGVLEVPSS